MSARLLFIQNAKNHKQGVNAVKLWAGRFSKEIDKKTNDFNSSISFDSRMYREDIEGSIAHAEMIGECGIIEKSESEAIIKGLEGLPSMAANLLCPTGSPLLPEVPTSFVPPIHNQGVSLAPSQGQALWSTFLLTCRLILCMFDY